MALKAHELETGQEFTAVLVEDLKRTQIVQYAGSSGDYNPVHTDEKFAREIAGYPGVFAHGMLSMAYLGRLLTDTFPQQQLRSWKVRFAAITPVHAQPVCTGRITSIDRHQIEAARDLGATPFRAFLHVTLPLSRPALLAGSALVVLPMFGDYYTNPFLSSGSPRTEMVGNQIERYLRGTSQPQTGASLVLILSVMLLVLMAYYLVVTVRAQRAVAT